MLPDPPLPILANWFEAAGNMIIDFDKPLQAGATAAGNWEGCIQTAVRNLRNQVLPGAILGNQVTVPMVVGALCFGVDRVSYDATPADVIGTNGMPVAAFSGFPVVFNP